MDGHHIRGAEVSRLASEAPALAAMARDPAGWALFLDIDGTLLDIAPRPDAVEVPPGLADTLAAVLTGLGGAMALITGRGIAFADQLFAPRRFPLAGLHGTEMRLPDGRVTGVELTPAFLRAKEVLRNATRDMAGVVFEDKGAATAVHYRLAPAFRERVEAMMEEAARLAGPRWRLQYGKMVVELRPASADKGKALAGFMREAPFAARRPIAIGDDLTDEDMFAAARAHGGRAIRIGLPEPQAGASDYVRSPAQLRCLLALTVDVWRAG